MRPFARLTGHRGVCLVAAVLLATVTACGQDRDPGESNPPDAAPEPALEGMLEGMEEDYGCGHGFYASNADQTHGLFIFASDPQATEDELGIPGQVELPDDQWDAYVETGENLFANWCDDVVMPDDPGPVTDATFDLTGGTMTVVQDGPEQFTAELTGVEVETSGGTVVELGEMTTTNELWGVYAG